MTTIEKNGVTYHPRWFSPMRVWSAHGANVPRNVPKSSPENVKSVVTSEAAQRPPRYATVENGLVNRICQVSRWKSRRMDVPKIAATMSKPNTSASESFSEFAKGPLSRTLPFELPTGPKLSEATHRNEKNSQTPK
jgi:hypothetical protein